MDWTFQGFDWHVVSIIFFGAISGYIASKILGGEGFGFLGNVFIGVVGGYLGTYMITLFKIKMLSGFIGTFITSVCGAIVLILILDFLKKPNKSTTSRTRTRR